MAGSDRLAIFPSRANLVWMKQRIVSAQNGLNLLKRKRDALSLHFRQLSAELKVEREKLNIVMADAIFSMAKANFLRTDFKPLSLMSPNRAEAYLRVKSTKLVGIQVPALELVLSQSNAYNLTGLASGGQQVRVVRQKFQEALKVLVVVASLQNLVTVIYEAVKQNNMRVNGLEYAVLPRYQNTLHYIREELEELEREEFYRLKRSQAKQLKKKSDFIKMMRQRQLKDGADYPGYDFVDAHLATHVDEILAAKPKHIMHERRKTISKVANKTIIIDTQDQKPFHLDTSISEMIGSRSKKRAKTKKVVPSAPASSEEEDSSD